MQKQIIYSALENFPIIGPGENISDLLIDSIMKSSISIQDNDILVIAQKIISKAENRFVRLSDVTPSNKAYEIAEKSGKDPREVELIIKESKEILRIRLGTIIVQHKLGFVCANAGIDHSNVHELKKNDEEFVLLLPKNPDLSARRIYKKMKREFDKKLGILIIDSHGRAWRQGVVGITIGLANIPALVDLRGIPDIFGYQLRITQIAAVDELAAGASLLMGQAAERTPVIHVRGFPYNLKTSELKAIIRPKNQDMFR